MSDSASKKVQYLIVDTTAFIQNAPLQDIAHRIVTCPEVVSEIKNKRQLRRLVVLPYDLEIKEPFVESIQFATEFSKKTGDYPSLSATDIKVIALVYQLHKELVGTDNIRLEPVKQRPEVTTGNKVSDIDPDVTGFFMPGKTAKIKSVNNYEEEDETKEDLSKLDAQLLKKFESLSCDIDNLNIDKCEDVLVPSQYKTESTDENYNEEEEEDDNGGWITPSNIKIAKKQINSELMEDKYVAVSCMTTDFAMQNVLKQMNLNVSALDGHLIKQLRTYILRCYSCFKMTSIMTKKFCPKCGNDTLKSVAVSLDENGEMTIYINPRKPLTGRGKKFSLPKIKGGKHPNNPILVEDQPMPDNRPSRLARTKTNPLDDDYIAGFSPFIMRDVNSKSAQLGIRPGQEVKYWMRKNPNEVKRKRR